MTKKEKILKELNKNPDITIKELIKKCKVSRQYLHLLQPQLFKKRINKLSLIIEHKEEIRHFFLNFDPNTKKMKSFNERFGPDLNYKDFLNYRKQLKLKNIEYYSLYI
jgi:hypothetical protein